MEEFIINIFRDYGVIGLVIVGLVVVFIKKPKILKQLWWELSDTTGETELVKTDILNQMGIKFDGLFDKINLLNEKIELVNDRVNDINERFDQRSDELEKKIDNQSSKFIEDIEIREQKKRDVHNKQMNDLLTLGPKLHKVLNDYIDLIYADHIFLGSFHNGSNSLSGIPYYKFDIIAEKILPVPNGLNRELAAFYKDVDVLRHNVLPGELINKTTLYFDISSEDSSDLDEMDSILYQRLHRSGVKQLALNVLKDTSGRPSGFVGCLRYDNSEKLNLDKLKQCADTLESIYHINEENN